MKLVIIDQENNKMQVGIDGVFYEDLDGSQLPEDIHAVQWGGSSGEIERKDPSTGKLTSNEEINSITDFQFAIDIWQAASDDAAVAAQELAALRAQLDAEYEANQAASE